MALLSVKLARELEGELSTWARENGLTRSQAARDLLRQALGHADPVNRGWREGFTAGRAEAVVAQNAAMHEVAKKAGLG